MPLLLAVAPRLTDSLQQLVSGVSSLVSTCTPVRRPVRLPALGVNAAKIQTLMYQVFTERCSRVFTGADKAELLQLDDIDFKWLIQTQREALLTISAADERQIRSDLLRRRETEVRAEEARQAALDAHACRQRRAFRQEADGLDFDLKVLTGGSANSRLTSDSAPSDADKAIRQRKKEEALHAMERAHAKAIAATEADNPHRDDYTSRWGVLVGSGDETRSWLMEKHNKERDKLLASFAEHEEASSIADTAGLRVTLMKMCSARALSTAGQLQDLQQRLRKWHAAREEPIADRPEDQR